MKAKLQLWTVIFLMTMLVLTMPGCASKATSEMDSAPQAVRSEEADAVEAEKPVPEDMSNRMVIRTASITVTVENVSEASKKLEKLVGGSGGYIESASVYGEPPSGRYTLRVPEDQFLKTLESIKTFGKVQYSSVGGEDVTQEFTDTEARLRNFKRQEEQYLEIMKKATTIEDIIKIENELSRIREQIEVMTGRVQYLEDQVKMGTVDVELTQEAGITESSGPSFGKAIAKAKQGAINSINMLLNLLASLVVLIGYLIPLVPFIWLGWYGYKQFKKRQALKPKKPTPEKPHMIDMKELNKKEDE